MHPPHTAPPANPALDRFLASFQNEREWAQVLIQRSGQDFLLRHIADRQVDPNTLRPVALPDLRPLSMFTADGRFRPLRSSPDLPRGWLHKCSGPAGLWRALQEIYPGSLPDWHAAASNPPPLTPYRDFAGRQSGMYRITQLLNDEQAAQVAAAACHVRFCLKRRLWDAPGLPADPAGEKSDIPCLEPCAILLELARKAARIEQETKAEVQLAGSELDSLLSAAEWVIENAGHAERTGNIGSPVNPRRLQLLLEKFKGKVKLAEKSIPEE